MPHIDWVANEINGLMSNYARSTNYRPCTDDQRQSFKLKTNKYTFYYVFILHIMFVVAISRQW